MDEDDENSLPGNFAAFLARFSGFLPRSALPSASPRPNSSARRVLEDQFHRARFLRRSRNSATGDDDQEEEEGDESGARFQALQALNKISTFTNHEPRFVAFMESDIQSLVHFLKRQSFDDQFHERYSPPHRYVDGMPTDTHWFVEVSTQAAAQSDIPDDAASEIHSLCRELVTKNPTLWMSPLLYGGALQEWDVNSLSCSSEHDGAVELFVSRTPWTIHMNESFSLRCSVLSPAPVSALLIAVDPASSVEVSLSLTDDKGNLHQFQSALDFESTAIPFGEEITVQLVFSCAKRDFSATISRLSLLSDVSSYDPLASLLLADPLQSLPQAELMDLLLLTHSPVVLLTLFLASTHEVGTDSEAMKRFCNRVYLLLERYRRSMECTLTPIRPDWDPAIVVDNFTRLGTALNGQKIVAQTDTSVAVIPLKMIYPYSYELVFSAARETPETLIGVSRTSRLEAATRPDSPEATTFSILQIKGFVHLNSETHPGPVAPRNIVKMRYVSMTRLLTFVFNGAEVLRARVPASEVFFPVLFFTKHGSTLQLDSMASSAPHLDVPLPMPEVEAGASEEGRLTAQVLDPSTLCFVGNQSYTYGTAEDLLVHGFRLEITTPAEFRLSLPGEEQGPWVPIPPFSSECLQLPIPHLPCFLESRGAEDGLLLAELIPEYLVPGHVTKEIEKLDRSKGCNWALGQLIRYSELFTNLVSDLVHSIPDSVPLLFQNTASTFLLYRSLLAALKEHMMMNLLDRFVALYSNMLWMMMQSSMFVAPSDSERPALAICDILNPRDDEYSDEQRCAFIVVGLYTSVVTRSFALFHRFFREALDNGDVACDKILMNINLFSPFLVHSETQSYFLEYLSEQFSLDPVVDGPPSGSREFFLFYHEFLTAHLLEEGAPQVEEYFEAIIGMISACQLTELMHEFVQLFYMTLCAYQRIATRFEWIKSNLPRLTPLLMAHGPELVEADHALFRVESVLEEFAAAALPPHNLFFLSMPGNRDDFTGLAGAELETSSPVWVTELGRFLTGGSLNQEHKVVLFDSAQVIPIAVVIVSPSSPRDEYGYQRERLHCPVKLLPKHRYIVLSQETSGSGDLWGVTEKPVFRNAHLSFVSGIARQDGKEEDNTSAITLANLYYLEPDEIQKDPALRLSEYEGLVVSEIGPEALRGVFGLINEMKKPVTRGTRPYSLVLEPGTAFALPGGSLLEDHSYCFTLIAHAVVEARDVVEVALLSDEGNTMLHSAGESVTTTRDFVSRIFFTPPPRSAAVEFNVTVQRLGTVSCLIEGPGAFCYGCLPAGSDFRQLIVRCSAKTEAVLSEVVPVAWSSPLYRSQQFLCLALTDTMERDLANGGEPSEAERRIDADRSFDVLAGGAREEGGVGGARRASDRQRAASIDPADLRLFSNWLVTQFGTAHHRLIYRMRSAAEEDHAFLGALLEHTGQIDAFGEVLQSLRQAQDPELSIAGSECLRGLCQSFCEFQLFLVQRYNELRQEPETLPERERALLQSVGSKLSLLASRVAYSDYLRGNRDSIASLGDGLMTSQSLGSHSLSSSEIKASPPLSLISDSVSPELVHRICQSCLAIVRSETTVEEIEGVMEARTAQCLKVIFWMKWEASLLQSPPCRSVLYQVLRSQLSTLTALSPPSHTREYMARVSGITEAVRGQLKSQFSSFVRILVGMLVDTRTDIVLFRVILHSLCLRFHVWDFQNLLSLLRGFSINSELMELNAAETCGPSPSLSYSSLLSEIAEGRIAPCQLGIGDAHPEDPLALARELLRVGAGLRSSVPAVPTPSFVRGHTMRLLSSYVVFFCDSVLRFQSQQETEQMEVAFSDESVGGIAQIYRNVQRLLRSVVRGLHEQYLGRSPFTLDPRQLEAQSLPFLELISHFPRHLVVRKLIESSLMQLLCDCLPHATCRVQRAILRLFMACLPRESPALVVPGVGIVEAILRLCESFFDDPRSSSASGLFPVYGTSFAFHEVVSEGITVLRTLSGSPLWRPCIEECLRSIVERDVELIQAEWRCGGRFLLVCALLGAFKETIREGGRALALDSGVECTVLRYERDSPCVAVLQHKQIVWDQSDNYQPLDDVAAPFFPGFFCGSAFLDLKDLFVYSYDETQDTEAEERFARIRLMEAFYSCLFYQSREPSVMQLLLNDYYYRPLLRLAVLPIEFSFPTHIIAQAQLRTSELLREMRLPDVPLFCDVEVLKEEIPTEQKLLNEDPVLLEAAQSLVDMGFGFSLDVCLLALKRNGRDLNATVNWLFSTEESELALLLSAAALRQDNDVDTGPDEQAMKAAQAIGDLQEFSGLESFSMARAVLEFCHDDMNSAMNYVLDHKIAPSEPPILLEPGPEMVLNSIDGMKKDIVAPAFERIPQSLLAAIRHPKFKTSLPAGALVAVATTSESGDLLQERVGLLQTACVTGGKAEVLFFDPRTQFHCIRRCPSDALRGLKTLFSLKGVTASTILDYLRKLYESLFVLSVREFLHRAYATLPPGELRLSELGEDESSVVSDFSTFLKLAVIKELPSKQRSERMQQCQQLMNRLLAADDSDLTSHLLTSLQMPDSAIDVSQAELRESVHPTPRGSSSGSIFMSEGRSLRIVFDQRTDLGSSVLVFSLDRKQMNVVATIRSGERPNCLTIPSSTVYYQFVARSSTWGYRFWACRNDEDFSLSESLISMNHSFAYTEWVLDAVLENAVRRSLGISREIIQLLMSYLNSQGSAHVSVIKCLTRYLSNASYTEFFAESTLVEDLDPILCCFAGALWKQYSKDPSSVSDGLRSMMPLSYSLWRIASRKRSVLASSSGLRAYKKPESSGDLVTSLTTVFTMLEYLCGQRELEPDSLTAPLLWPSWTFVDSSHPLKSNVAFRQSLNLGEVPEVTVVFDQRSRLPRDAHVEISTPTGYSTSVSLEQGDARQVTVKGGRLSLSISLPRDGSASAAAARAYGLSALVFPSATDPALESDLLARGESEFRRLSDLVRRNNAAASQDVTRFLDEIWTSKSLFQRSSRELVFTRGDDEMNYPALASVPFCEIHARASLLLYFNRFVSDLLGLFDIADSAGSGLGLNLGQASRYITMEVKQQYLNSYLVRSRCEAQQYTINLNNGELMQSQLERPRDPLLSHCLFMQTYRALSETRDYRVLFSSSSDKSFHVRLEGESGVDVGGLFRDSLSQAVSDLFSDYFYLFVPCGNSRSEVNINMDKYVPNPRLRQAAYLELFEFAGMLIGASIRHQFCLPFELPPFIWKLITAVPVSFEDIGQHDTPTYDRVQSLLQYSEAEYEDRFSDLTFEVVDANGQSQELIPGGHTIHIEYGDIARYVALVKEYMLHEYDLQAKAIRAGCDRVVSTRVLSVFTWNQVETLVCGSPDVDIEWLKENTVYHDYAETDPVIGFFWSVFSEMSAKERSQFIRFAYGRSRLNKQHLANKFTIQRVGGVELLPCAHTCFFTLDLPPYKTIEQLRKAILTCINYGVGGILLC